jgi:hypothetical protein
MMLFKNAKDSANNTICHTVRSNCDDPTVVVQGTPGNIGPPEVPQVPLPLGGVLLGAAIVGTILVKRLRKS